MKLLPEWFLTSGTYHGIIWTTCSGSMYLVIPFVWPCKRYKSMPLVLKWWNHPDSRRLFMFSLNHESMGQSSAQSNPNRNPLKTISEYHLLEDRLLELSRMRSLYILKKTTNRCYGDSGMYIWYVTYLSFILEWDECRGLYPTRTPITTRTCLIWRRSNNVATPRWIPIG